MVVAIRTGTWLFQFPLVCCLFGPLLSPVFCQEQSAIKEPLAISAQVNVTRSHARDGLIVQQREIVYLVNSDLGVIPAGTPVALAITLKNETDQPIDFADVSSTCNCVNIAVSSYTIPVGESIVLSANGRSLEHTNKMNSAFSFSLKDEQNNLVVQLGLKYSISGHLRFKTDKALLEIPYGKEFQDVFIPLTISDPVSLSNLSITYDDDLRDLLFKLKTDTEGNPGVLVTVARAAVYDRPVYGAVTCVDSVTGKSGSCQLSVRAQEPIMALPTITWFRKKDHLESPSGEIATRTYIGHALILIDDSLVRELGPEQSSAPQISVVSETFSGLKREIKKVKPNLFRAKLSFEVLPNSENRFELPDELADLAWTITFSHEHKFKIKSLGGVEK